jgi:tetratricopeptide (TPR) repeat protein
MAPVSGIAAVGAWSYWQEQQGLQAKAEERFDDAQRHVDSALKVRPRSTALHLLAARVARQRGAFAEAEQHLSRCQQLGGMTEPLQLEWLLLRCHRGEMDELAPLLLSAVDHGHPESTSILETLAAVYIRQARYHEAMQCLNRWIDLDPQSARALDSRGWLYNQFDGREPAIADYERALQIQPGRSAVRMRLADVLLKSLRHGEAAAHLERLRAEQPDNPAVMARLAQCWAALSRAEEARLLLDQLLAAHPENFDALLQRAKLDLAAGNFADAEQRLRRALEQSPRDLDARYSLYLSLEGQGNRQREAQEELARWGQHRDARVRLTNLLQTELPEHPSNPNLAEEAGELFLQIGEDQRGLYWLHRALAIDPGHGASHRALAGYYERTGNAATAEEHRRQLGALAAPPR